MRYFNTYSLMKKVCLFILCVIALASCNQTDKKNYKQSEKSGNNLHLAIYDVTFDDYIFTPSISNNLEKSLASIFCTGLFRSNPTSLEVETSICTAWEVDNSGSVYTFHIDSTAKFHEDECFGHERTRTVTAYDVKYTFHILANPEYSAENFANTVSQIKGAKEYFAMNAAQRDTSRIEGIKILDKNTIQITLEQPSTLFIQKLAHPAASIIPEEAVKKYGKNSTVSIGPFRYEADEFQFRFIKCLFYTGIDENNDKLPYLDTVFITKTKNFEETVTLFSEGKIDAMLLVPSSKIAEVVKKFPSDLNYEILEANYENLISLGKGPLYNIVRTYVKDLHTNRFNILELERTYIKKK